MAIPVVISWSSGKDAMLTLERLNADPHYQVVGLFTTFTDNQVPFQATPISVLQAQASLLGLPLILIELPDIFPPNHVYQTTVVEGLKQSGIEFSAVAFGDLFCNGIAEYRRGYIEPQGWQCLFPLMGTPSLTLAQEIIARGIETYVITVDTEQLSAHHCGQKFTREWVEQLPAGVDPCGENGEFHTLVVNGPSFVHGALKLEMISQEHDIRFSHQRYRAITLPKSP